MVTDTFNDKRETGIYINGDLVEGVRYGVLVVFAYPVGYDNASYVAQIHIGYNGSTGESFFNYRVDPATPNGFASIPWR